MSEHPLRTILQKPPGVAIDPSECHSLRAHWKVLGLLPDVRDSNDDLEKCRELWKRGIRPELDQINADTARRNEIVDRLTVILCDIDKILLWWLLFMALDTLTPVLLRTRPLDTRHPTWIIFEAIGQVDCYLSFQSNKGDSDIAEYLKRTSPIQICTDESEYGLLLEPLLKHCHDGNKLHVAFDCIYGSDSRESVLCAAIQTRNIAAIRIMLEKCPSLALHPTVAEKVVWGANNNSDRVELLQIAEMLVRVDGFRTAELLDRAILDSNLDLVHIYYASHLLGPTEPVDLVHRLIEFLMMDDEGLLSLEGFQQACTSHPNRDLLLHLAVRARREQLVQFLARTTDGCQTRDPTLDRSGDKYPLWYNNNPSTWISSGGQVSSNNDAGQIDDVKLNIRNSIVKEIIRNCLPSEVDDIIVQSDDRIGEYSFDLSDIDTTSTNFNDLMESFKSDYLRDKYLRQTLQFEAVLKYAELPKLPSVLTDAAIEHKDIDTVLDWLKVCGVDEIIDLQVPDRLWGAHNEECIAKWTQYFKVTKLNWRCQDLSFKHLSMPNRYPSNESRPLSIQELTHIHLYTSGKSAVHQYWFGPDGLIRFPKLQQAYIHIIEDFLPESLMIAAEEELDNLQMDFSNTYQQKHANRNGIPDELVIIDRYQWNDRAREVHGESIQKITSLAFPRLESFLDQYRYITPPRRTRVAILDNGVMAMRSYRGREVAGVANGAPIGGPAKRSSQHSTRGIMRQVVAGKSFAYRPDGRKSSWFTAADPHGSQMATLICALDPGCELLVAKVGVWGPDISHRPVTKAIEWAISNKVDIISMSFAFSTVSDDLVTAIKKANEANIVLFASCHDQGSNRPHAYPTDYKETISIAACNQEGTLIFGIPEDKYQFRLNGYEIFVGRVAHVNSKERITGSSVSTATAAGLASLTLSCLYAAGVDVSAHEGVEWKRKLIEAFFGYMNPADDKSRKYVSPAQFCDLDSEKSTAVFVAKDRIQKWFHDKYELHCKEEYRT